VGLRRIIHTSPYKYNASLDGRIVEQLSSLDTQLLSHNKFTNNVIVKISHQLGIWSKYSICITLVIFHP